MGIRRAVLGAWLGILVAVTPSAWAGEATLDPAFGTGGTVLTPIDLSGIARIALQADGKVLVPGYMIPSDVVAAIARYDALGALDGSFGSGGIATTTYVLARGEAATSERRD